MNMTSSAVATRPPISIPETTPDDQVEAGQAKRRRSRDREPFRPDPIDATVYWWWTNDGRTACMENQFSEMPATPVRFRCIGSLSTKYPRRFRVDLVQALDWLPELNRRELKALGVTLAGILSKKMGVDVVAVSSEVIDTVPVISP